MRSPPLSARSTPVSRARPASDRPARRGPIRIAQALVLWAAALVGGTAPSDAAGDKRVALVIGNAAYTSFPALVNPTNDASDIETAFKLLGFTVLKGSDLTRAATLDLIARFQAEAKDADAVVFYYAGHGFQIDQRNYLVPVDATITKAEEVRGQTIDLLDITDHLGGPSGSRLIFLDACRDNPLRKRAGQIGVSAQLQDGLARVGSAAGFLFAYATQPDNRAYDGGGRNSPFAQALLGHLSVRGQDVNAMMIEVRKDVIAATGGSQVPWENSSLTKQFYFAPGQLSPLSPETQLWQLAAATRDASLLRVYMDRYPEGAHAKEAQQIVKVASLDPAVPGASRSTSDVDRLSDDRLWDLAQRSRIRALVEFYIERRPDGLHVGSARQLLQSLPSADENDSKPEVVCERNATHPRDATANTPGVPLADVARNGEATVAACRAARAAHPEMPHYAALLARALAATGQRSEAITLYRSAAEQGDLRAMVSLGLIVETGDGAPRDLKAAYSLYSRAAGQGSPDGAINLAVALLEGNGIARDPARAVELLKRASDAGSAIANYNLGVLAERGVYKGGSALQHFVRATELGDPRGFLSAAILLDEGRTVAKNPIDASEMLLRGAASDTGEVIDQIVHHANAWSNDTLRTLQTKLRSAGYYNGPIDGKGGVKMRPSLERWRQSGTVLVQ